MQPKDSAGRCVCVFMCPAKQLTCWLQAPLINSFVCLGWQSSYASDWLIGGSKRANSGVRGKNSSFVLGEIHLSLLTKNSCFCLQVSYCFLPVHPLSFHHSVPIALLLPCIFCVRAEVARSICHPSVSLHSQNSNSRQGSKRQGVYYIMLCLLANVKRNTSSWYNNLLTFFCSDFMHFWSLLVSF